MTMNSSILLTSSSRALATPWEFYSSWKTEEVKRPGLSFRSVKFKLDFALLYHRTVSISLTFFVPHLQEADDEGLEESMQGGMYTEREPTRADTCVRKYWITILPSLVFLCKCVTVFS